MILINMMILLQELHRTVNDAFFVTRQPVAIVVFIVGFLPSNVKCIKVTVAVICGKINKIELNGTEWY